jgi:hypothetical protein
MFVEAGAAALGKGLATRLAATVGGNVLRSRQDRAALERAVVAAAQDTARDRDHRLALSRYDVNVDFFAREAVAEVERIMLPGRGPDARRLATLCIRSLEGDPDDPQHGALVVALDAFLANLVEHLGQHERFRVAIADVAGTRDVAVGDEDERELVRWLSEHFSYIQTAGIGTSHHLQVALEDVFVMPRAIREQTPGTRWPTRAQEQLAILEDRLRSGEMTAEEYEARLDRLGAVSANDVAEPEPLGVVELLGDSDRVVVLGDPGTGKTTLLRYLVLRHAKTLLRGASMVSAELGQARLPVFVSAGAFARADQRDRGLGAFLAPYLADTLECPLVVVAFGHPRADEMG